MDEESRNLLDDCRFRAGHYQSSATLVMGVSLAALAVDIGKVAIGFSSGWPATIFNAVLVFAASLSALGFLWVLEVTHEIAMANFGEPAIGPNYVDKLRRASMHLRMSYRVLRVATVLMYVFLAMAFCAYFWAAWNSGEWHK